MTPVTLNLNCEVRSTGFSRKIPPKGGTTNGGSTNLPWKYRAIAMLMAFVVTPGIASAQDEAIDMIRRFPVEYIGLNEVQVAVAQLEWLEVRQLSTQENLAKQLAAADAEIDSLRQQRGTLVESLPLEFRYADDRARSEAVSRCLQEILSIRLEMATQNATLENEESDEWKEKIESLKMVNSKLEELELQVSSAKIALQQAQNKVSMLVGSPNEDDATARNELVAAKLDLEAVRAEFDKRFDQAKLLRSELTATDGTQGIQYMKFRLDTQKRDLSVREKEIAVQQASEALAQSKQLLEKGFVTIAQVGHDVAALAGAQAELDTEQLSYSIHWQQVVSAVDGEQVKVNLEIRKLQAREKATQSFLEQLNGAATVNQQIRQLDEQIEAAQVKKTQLMASELAVQQEIADSEILKKQIQKALAVLAEKSARESDPENRPAPKEDDKE